MRPKVFTHSQILKMFPWINSRTMITWCERGLVVPEFGDAEGRGSSRRYGFHNLIEIAVIAELVEWGLPFMSIHGIQAIINPRSAKAPRMLKRGNYNRVIYICRARNLVSSKLDTGNKMRATWYAAGYDADEFFGNVEEI